ncbi:DMT family transporter [Gudongella sp. DL1XJH-153]|uniref:DMT family transporter n=1 Tax=Gudongella sp. DL1XJH-153 TaxID=3409804 RepID=UPI003BB72C61
MTENRFLPYMTALGYSMIFGMSFMFTKIGLGYMSTIQLIAYRFLVAGLTMQILRALKLIKLDFKGKDLKLVIITAMFQPVLYFFFEVEGVNLTSTSQAGLMVSLVPVTTAIGARILFKERLKYIQIMFIILSVSGVVVINAFNNSQGLSGSTLGMAFLTMSLFAGTMFSLSSKRASREFTPVEITYTMMTMGAIVFNATLLVRSAFEGTMATYFEPLGNPEVIVPILYLGLLSSIVAFFFLNFTISRIPVSQSAIFGNLVTVFAILAGVFILNEPFGLKDVIGAIMIVTGVWGTLYFGQKKKKGQNVIIS